MAIAILRILWLAATVFPVPAAGGGAAVVIIDDAKAMVLDLNEVCLYAPELVEACAAAAVVDATVGLLSLAAIAVGVHEIWPKQSSTCHSGLLSGDVDDMKLQYRFMVERVQKWKGFVSEKRYGDLYADTHNMLQFGRSFLMDLKDALKDADTMKSSRRLSSNLAMTGPWIGAPVAGSVATQLALSNSAPIMWNKLPLIVSGGALAMMLTGCGNDKCHDVKEEVHNDLIHMRSHMNNALGYISDLHDCVSTKVPQCDATFMKSQVTYIKQWLALVGQKLQAVSRLNGGKPTSQLLREGAGTDSQISKLELTLLEVNVSSMADFLSIEVERFQSLAVKAHDRILEHQTQDDSTTNLCSQSVHVAASFLLVLFGCLGFRGLALFRKMTAQFEGAWPQEGYIALPVEPQLRQARPESGHLPARPNVMEAQPQAAYIAEPAGPHVRQVRPEIGRLPAGPIVMQAQPQATYIAEPAGQPQAVYIAEPAGPHVRQARPEIGRLRAGPIVMQAQPQATYIAEPAGQPQAAYIAEPAEQNGMQAQLYPFRFIFFVMLLIPAGYLFYYNSACPSMTTNFNLESMQGWESRMRMIRSNLQTQNECLQMSRCSITEMNDLKGQLVSIIKSTVEDMEVVDLKLSEALDDEEECLQAESTCTMDEADSYEKQVILLTNTTATKAIES